jgi:hypothetical protein
LSGSFPEQTLKKSKSLPAKRQVGRGGNFRQAIRNDGFIFCFKSTVEIAKNAASLS